MSQTTVQNCLDTLNTPRFSHCDGCDDDEFQCEIFVVVTPDGAELVKYCIECAALAGINWSGTIEKIVGPIKKRHCPTCTIESVGLISWPVPLANCIDPTH